LHQDSKTRELSGLGWLFLISMLTHIAGMIAVSFLPQKGIIIPVEVNLVFSEISILVPSVIFILIRNYDFRRDLGFRPIKAGTVLMCILLTCFLTPVASFVNLLSQLFVSNTMAQNSDSLTGGSNMMVLFLGALYGPFCEELLFRGIFCNRYEKYLGPMRAGLVSALFFALAHMNLNQAAYAFVLGVIFAVVNKAGNSIYPSLIIHICINASNIIVLFAITKFADALGGKNAIAAAAEKARLSDALYYMIGVTLVGAVICTAIAIPCIVWISKHENNFEGLRDMFVNRHRSAGWLTIPAALAIFIVLFLMFGFKPVINLVKGV